MRSKRLQQQITTGRFTLPVVIFSCILCCGLTNLLLFPLPAGDIDYPFWNNIRAMLPEWSIPVLSFATFSIIGYFLIEINNRFSIIGIRASVQTSLYFLLVMAIPWLYALHAGCVAAVALLFSIFFLFKSYQQTAPSGNLFHSFVSMGIASLFFPQILYFAPLWWIASYRFQSLTLRSFCASLIGWSLPYWFLLGHAFYHQQMELFYQPFTELLTFHSIRFMTDMQLHELVNLAYLLLLFIVSSIHCMVAGYKDKIRTRLFLNFLMQQGLFFFIYILLQPIQFENILPLLLIPTSILSAHFFGLTNSRLSNLFFIAMMVALIILYAFNLWILL